MLDKNINIFQYPGADYSIDPDIIFNRFDLCGSTEYVTICLSDEESERYIMVKICKRTAELGCFLMDISQEEFELVIKFVFDNFKTVSHIKYNNSVRCAGAYKENPQRYIDLPDSEDELHARLTQKNRYNIKREKRLIRDNIGEFELVHYNAYQAPDELMEFYFKSKKQTHKRDFRMTGKEYIDKAHVTDIYALRTSAELLAVVLSCEQCKSPFFENFSYNTEYSKYSIGSVIYDMYLIELIKKGIKRVYIGSDLYEYKKHYGSVRQSAYSGDVYRIKLKTNMIRMVKQIYRGLMRYV